MNTKTMKFAAIGLLLAIVSGCATRPANVAPQAISTMRYDGASCRAVAAELESVNGQLATASSALETKANQDTAAVVIGAVLFWPALFFIQGGAAQEAEVARLKGEQIALNKKLLDCGGPVASAK
jgi:hypothetical protein